MTKTRPYSSKSNSFLSYTAPALEKEINTQVREVLKFDGKTEYDIIERGMRTLAQEKAELERELQAVRNRLGDKDAADPFFTYVANILHFEMHREATV